MPYRFERVPEPVGYEFRAICLACDEPIPLGLKWADLNGPAFKAYYCDACKRELEQAKGDDMITIQIKTDNATFSDDDGPPEGPAHPLKPSRHASAGRTPLRADVWNLHDSNGNTVGSVRITPSEDTCLLCGGPLVIDDTTATVYCLNTPDHYRRSLNT